MRLKDIRKKSFCCLESRGEIISTPTKVNIDCGDPFWGVALVVGRIVKVVLFEFVDCRHGNTKVQIN